MSKIVFACHPSGTPHETIGDVDMPENVAWGGDFDHILFPRSNAVAHLIAMFFKDNSERTPTNLHGIDIGLSDRTVFGLPLRDLAHHAQNNLDVIAGTVMEEIEEIVFTDPAAERILVLCGSNSPLLYALQELQALHQKIRCTGAAHLPDGGMSPFDAIVATYEGDTVRLEFVTATPVHAD